MAESSPLSPSEMSRLREKRERHKKAKADPLAPLDELLERLLEKHIDPSIVAQTAQWMAAHDALSMQVQIKLRAFAISDRTKSFNHKVMLFYVLHEFLKIGAPIVDAAPATKKQPRPTTSSSFDAVRRTRHVEWMATVENILHACVRESYRDMKPVEEHRKKLLKTLARWDELGIYRGKLKEWKKVVLGETKVRKAPQRVLQDVVNPHDKEGLDLRRELHRGNIAWFFEPSEFRSPRAKLRHWRFTGIAFIDTLGRCLGLEAHVVLAAMTFYQTLFKRGFYAKERYKLAAAALFLSAKASSQRMKLLRMVHVMHYVLETPLVTGDEEKEELERLHLLHYELQVLQGIEFNLTIALPFDEFAAMAAQFPTTAKDAAHVILKDIYWTKMCIEFPAKTLATAAWCIAAAAADPKAARKPKLDKVLEHDCDLIHDYYTECKEWKAGQLAEFDSRTVSDDDLNRYLAVQRGGLTIAPDTMENPREKTSLKPAELERMGEARLASVRRSPHKTTTHARQPRDRSASHDTNHRSRERRRSKSRDRRDNSDRGRAWKHSRAVRTSWSRDRHHDKHQKAPHRSSRRRSRSSDSTEDRRGSRKRTRSGSTRRRGRSNSSDRRDSSRKETR